MKINWKSSNLVYLFILGELFAAIAALLMIVLMYFRILPSDKEWHFRSFNSFDEALNYWIFLFIGMSIIPILSLFWNRKLVAKVDLICPSCEDVQTVPQNQTEVVCKKCGTKLVPLKGFYDKKNSKHN